MPAGLRPDSYARIILYGLAIVLAITLLYGASTSGAAFGLYNPQWDGTSALRGQAADLDTDVAVAENTTAYDRVAAADTVAFVLSPAAPYTAPEVDRIERFVRAGGTLVIAEDTGRRGNRLLAELNASARVNGAILRDQRSHYRSPSLPIATNITANALTGDVETLTLNYGSAVEPGAATVLIASTDYAFLDLNDNGEPDDAERVGRYPVVTIEDLGNGSLVTVSDPSVFINAMLERPGNEQFARTLLGTHETALFDYSHSGSVPPLQAILLLLGRSPLLQALSGVAVLALLVGWERGWLGLVRSRVRRRASRRSGSAAPAKAAADATAEAEDFEAYLRQEYPEWGARRLQRVAAAVDAAQSDDDHSESL